MVDNSSQEVLWNVTGLNARGQVTTSLMGNNQRKNYTYDAYGYMTELKSERNVNTTPLQLLKLTFAFDTQKGLLMSRTNSLFAWSENFTYDNLDRLVNFNDNTGSKSHTYDTQGRITNNTNVGTYAYTGKSYQLTNLTLNTTGQVLYAPTTRQDISYNAFKSPVEITEAGKDKVSFQYNALMGRSNMFYGSINSDKMLRPMRKHYSADGSMEITHEKDTDKTTFIIYIGGDAYSAPAIWRSEQHTTTNQIYFYLHRDYLGSIIGITDRNGNFKEKRHFDAWGNLVKLTDGYNVALTKFGVFDRGYTGHEHLLGVGLVHMNGRLYDPVLHRFLMPDNFVQDPFNTQNFNRYGYVLNNPLSYVDPSGELAWFVPIIIGAIIGGTSAAIAGGNFGQIVGGALIGAASGFVGGGIGSLASGGTFMGAGVASTMSLGGAALGGAAGGFIGGVGTAWLNGANFGEGLGAGLKGSLVGGAGGLFGMIGGGSFAANTAYGIAGGGITGGLAALLSGGNIGQGMLYGGMAGGAFAAVTSGIEGYGNYRKGHGFRTDYGVIKNYTRAGQHQKAINFVQDRYGLGGPNMTYDPNLNDYGVTYLNSGDIKIGPMAFSSPSMLKATIIHEYTHSVSDRIFVNNRWQWNIEGSDSWNYNDGIRAYASEIYYSGAMNINTSVLSMVTNGFQVNPVWHQPGIINGRFWHTIPRRF